MNRRTALVPVFVAAAVCVAGLALLGSATGQTAGTCRLRWVVDRRPAATMNAVAVAGKQVWAVGSGGVVLHFDGRHWSSSTVPAAVDLTSVATDGTAVWALDSPRVYGWTGRGWRLYTVSGLPRARRGLGFSGLAARGGAVWLAGYYDDTNYAGSGDWGENWLIARLHAGRWRVFRGGGSYARLAAITARSPVDVWAVGHQGPTTADAQEVVLHWNGSKWTDLSRYDYVYGLNDVLAFSTADAWAVGDTNLDAFEQRADRPSIEHWNGREWVRVVPAWRWSTAPSLLALAAFGPRDVWAGGHRFNGAPALLHWDGARWSEATAPPVKTTIRDLATGPTHTLWAVGEHVVAHGRCAT